MAPFEDRYLLCQFFLSHLCLQHPHKCTTSNCHGALTRPHLFQSYSLSRTTSLTNYYLSRLSPLSQSRGDTIKRQFALYIGKYLSAINYSALFSVGIEPPLNEVLMRSSILASYASKTLRASVFSLNSTCLYYLQRYATGKFFVTSKGLTSHGKLSKPFSSRVGVKAFLPRQAMTVGC